MNIVLLGFMGTGKTVAAKVLARKLKMCYVDIDDEIEKESNMSISRIFSDYGEGYFRTLEKKAVLKISKGDKQVVSSGGGVVLDPENIRKLENNGILFCLDARPEIIYERICRFTHRPLVQRANTRKSIAELLKKREKYYARIKKHIDTSDLTLKEVAGKIIAEYENETAKPSFSNNRYERLQ